MAESHRLFNNDENEGDKMITEVYSNIYKNEILLPNNPLKAINSYIIRGEDRNLIIDTGFNIPGCKDAFMKGMEELGIELKKTSLLVTHLHSDHSGLAAALQKEGVTVCAGAIDGRLINEMTEEAYWDRFKDYGRLFDLEKDNISFHDHPGYKYCPKEPIDFIYLKEGDVLKVGEYTFEIVDIPGHTPGHIGLYERKHKLFFCGDHILDKITPNITFWGFEQDILSVYFNNLRKVAQYDIALLLTAHRSTVKYHRKRIQELLEHHRLRLNEILMIIKESKKSVRDTAAAMHWELRYDRWEDFPNPQKWFAAGEAMAHLEHLVATGEAEKIKESEIIYYKAK